ncbi:hypothetical protein [Pseudorhodobacter ferrugineus]|uniref:hypothetical protein n=1 Tax=Pseudorhodobacter ferrugineus TaxID=77008 RepID=UPI0003B482D5|nr:hypothetical protein [Pseudorhodobacter ferrugineus]
MMIEDGASNWGPNGPKPEAEGFDMDARHKSIYEWVRQVRGGVLGGVFTIERHLSAAIVYFMLGDRVERDEVQTAFDEGLLTTLTFDRRINVVLLIAPHFLTKDEVNNLRGDLTELRTIRNSMAHKPFWLHPELNDKGEVFNLVPMIQHGKASIALTTPFTEGLNQKIASLIDRSSKLAAAIIKREVGQHTATGA